MQQLCDAATDEWSYYNMNTFIICDCVYIYLVITSANKVALA